jgi:integrase
MDLREKGTAKRGARGGRQSDTGRPLTARTINAVRQSVAVALAEAARLGLIRDNPAARAPKLAEQKTERGVLTVAEARAVLGAPWADQRAYAASLLAATTGMRLGEVRALKLESIGAGEIEIKSSWSNLEGGKDPKWRSIRTVPVPAHVEATLRALTALNPWGDGFVFYGGHRGRPRGGMELRAGLQAALAAAGIPKDRGVTFHSWRHFYNSQMRDRIPDHALRQLTGHRSEAMTERYTHITQESRDAVAMIAGQIIAEATKV